LLKALFHGLTGTAPLTFLAESEVEQPKEQLLKNISN